MPNENNNRPLLHIAARRWFDGVNTYHSVCVTLPSGAQVMREFDYGYGEQYRQTASEIIGYASYQETREHFRIVEDVCEVTRRRDLHGRGRTMRPKQTART